MSSSSPSMAAATAELTRLRAELAAARAAQAQAGARAAYYQQLFEQPHKAVLIIRNGVYTDCNNMALELLGLGSRAELLGRAVGSFSAPTQPGGRSTAERVADALEQARQLGWTRISWLGRRHNGQEFWEDLLVTAIWLEGEVLYHVSWENTSEQWPRPATSESEDRLQLALAATASGVWVCHLPTRQVHSDQRVREILGAAEAVRTTLALKAQVPPEDQPLLRAAFRRSVHNRQPFEVEFRLEHPTAGTRYLSAIGQVQLDARQRPLRITGLLRDVTDRHLTRHELTLKSQLLERMLYNLPLILGRFDRQNRLLELTGAGLRYLHTTDNAEVGRPANYLIPDVQPYIDQVLAGQNVRFLARGESRGEPVYLQCFGFFDETQQCGVIFSINVTESELSKEQLRSEKEFTERLLNHSVDAIVACDPQGRITAWNRVMERLSGCAAATMLGQLLPEFAVFRPDTPPGAALHRLLAGELTPHYNVPFHCHDQDCEANLLPLQLSEGPAHGVLVVIRDVTQRNALTAQAAQLQRRQQQEILTAVLETQETERRRIAEGLHNGVGQLLYAAKLSLPPAAEMRDTRTLLEEAIRATRTISFELTPGVLADFGLKTALQELFKRVPHQHLRLRVQNLPERLPAAVEMAAYRIGQELLNNILKHAQASEATLEARYENGLLLLAAQDNGIGFAPDLAAALPPQGMGLTSIRHRVELLQGTLTVDSGPGRGTYIRIGLPCWPEATA